MTTSSSAGWRELFNTILGEAGLKFDRDGNKRAAYSLRHTYICFRLIEGADIYQIAKNCRTSVEMIENFTLPTSKPIWMQRLSTFGGPGCGRTSRLRRAQRSGNPTFALEMAWPSGMYRASMRAWRNR